MPRTAQISETSECQLRMERTRRQWPSRRLRTPSSMPRAAPTRRTSAPRPSMTSPLGARSPSSLRNAASSVPIALERAARSHPGLLRRTRKDRARLVVIPDVTNSHQKVEALASASEASALADCRASFHGHGIAQVALSRAHLCFRHHETSRARAESPSTTSATIARESPTAANLLTAPQIFMAMLPTSQCASGTLPHGLRAASVLVHSCQAGGVLWSGHNPTRFARLGRVGRKAAHGH